MENQIALVTGGTGGIGTSICQQLSRQGFQVIAGYSNETKAKAWQEQQRALGYSFSISYANVTDYDSCLQAVLNIEEVFGPIAVLINNAGITKDKKLHKLSREMWHQVIDTNLTSVFNMTQPIVKLMRERGYGRIINISSVNGQKGQAGQTNYAAAKAGMHGFTMSLAQEVANKGITVNTISPGYIATEMVLAIKEEIRQQIIADIPVKRLGEPEEVAQVVSFLAAPTSGYITGSNIAINGGLHM